MTCYEINSWPNWQSTSHPTKCHTTQSVTPHKVSHHTKCHTPQSVTPHKVSHLISLQVFTRACNIVTLLYGVLLYEGPRRTPPPLSDMTRRVVKQCLETLLDISRFSLHTLQVCFNAGAVVSSKVPASSHLSAPTHSSLIHPHNLAAPTPCRPKASHRGSGRGIAMIILLRRWLITSINNMRSRSQLPAENIPGSLVTDVVLNPGHVPVI